LTAAARQAVSAADPDQPVTDVQTMDQYVAAALSDRQSSMILLAIFSCLATLLAAVGIYGVLSYLVSEQAREIGVRVALGAQAGDIMRWILRRGLRLAVGGLIVGIGVALAGRRLLASLLYGIAPGDPVTLGAAAVVLLGVALAACVIPARRAARVDPIVTLREE
jgi:putative ABC transport system permease protein